MVYRVEIARDIHWREWNRLAFPKLAEQCARARLTDAGCMGDGRPADGARVVEESTGTITYVGQYERPTRLPNGEVECACGMVTGKNLNGDLPALRPCGRCRD